MYEFWLEGFFEGVAKYHPEIKNAIILSPEIQSAHVSAPVYNGVPPKHGITILEHRFYAPGTTDYYPVLTDIVSKNPDAIIPNGNPGESALILKQARELGYEGFILFAQSVPVDTLLDMAGPTYTWSILNAEPDWSKPAYSQHARDLNEEWKQNHRLPGEVSMNITTRNGYASIMFIKAAIEAAGSIDPTDVLNVVDNGPVFTFDNFFDEAVSVGGLEYLGIKRHLPQGVAYGEIVDAENINLSMEVYLVITP